MPNSLKMVILVGVMIYEMCIQEVRVQVLPPVTSNEIVVPIVVNNQTMLNMWFIWFIYMNIILI